MRKLLNQALLLLLMAQGLDTAIVEPCDSQLMANIRAAEALLGRDEFCANHTSRRFVRESWEPCKSSRRRAESRLIICHSERRTCWVWPPLPTRSIPLPLRCQ